VNHEAKKTHHSGTALVELNGTLLNLGLLIERVPSEIDEAIAEVTNELPRLGTIGRVLHDEDLKEANEGEELEKARSGDGLEGTESSGDGVEGGAREVDVTRETDSSSGSEVPGNAKHGNTAVLDLDIPKAVEVGLVAISDKAKGVEEAKRGLCHKERRVAEKFEVSTFDSEARRRR